MTYSTRPPTLSKRTPPTRGGGVPSWVVFFTAIALVFAGYYLWTGLQDYLETGGLGIAEATQQAEIVATSTARSQPRSTTANIFGVTAPPTQTPIPPCEDFIVVVDNGFIRSDPTTRGNILTSVIKGTQLCVVGRAAADAEWYIIDTNPLTRRLDEAYIREDLVEPLNPTPTPSNTATPMPTVTTAPSLTPSITSTPTVSPTHNPDVSDTPQPPTMTLTPSPTQALQSA